jgi:hypothetical protein
MWVPVQTSGHAMWTDGEGCGQSILPPQSTFPPPSASTKYFAGEHTLNSPAVISIRHIGAISLFLFFVLRIVISNARLDPNTETAA